ncbi:SH3 domain-binding protein [Schistosoma japonicum]|nr:SH3 domain-binding protein [Schistosoma japonicum]
MNHSHQYDPYTFPSEEVEIQLDILNKTSTQINELEKRLEISYDTYRRVLSDHSNKLLELSKKLGKCVSRTRLYNEFRQKQACRRKEIQLAALKYDNAISALNVARDKLAKLESCVLEPGFNDANKLLNNAKLEHEKLMEIYAANEQSIHQFEKRHRFDINKAKPYYTMYDHFMLEMEAPCRECLYRNSILNLKFFFDL